MSTVTWSTSQGARRLGHVFCMLLLAEACTAAACMARLAFGPPSLSPNPLLWLGGAALFLGAYLGLAMWSAARLSTVDSSRDGAARAALWLSTAPFLGAFSLGLLVLQFRPGLGAWLFDMLFPIQPLPFVGSILLLMAVLLGKLLAVAHSLPRGNPLRERTMASAAAVAVPVALLLIGLLQASVYVTPIGNPFLRYWAIADAAATGAGYPVTLTEPEPMRAGSPPYVYDLPLFPLMLLAAFTLFGRSSAAAHLPAALFNLLFPLSLYLLIKQMTGSRTAGLLFATLASLFPFLRFWVLNLPDPDPVLLTSACLAGYFYLRALKEPRRTSLWIAAGVAGGILGLARPEGVLYTGFITLAILLSRPGIRQLAIYSLGVGSFLAPMVYTWWTSFGFLWPQNYNRTLSLEHPLRTYEALDGYGALRHYVRGLGLETETALALLALFCISVLLGLGLMAIKDRWLLAIALPGIGNSVIIFFTNPWISNAYHYSDFFRHTSFGIPFLVATAAYGLHGAYRYLAGRRRARIAAYVLFLLLVAAVVREGDILANPTVTHRPNGGWPPPTQVLATYVHLTMQDILRHPMAIPPMSYHEKDGVVVAYPTGIAWPEDGLEHFKPLDMTFERAGGHFGYASVAAFLLALGFALLGSGFSCPQKAVSSTGASAGVPGAAVESLSDRSRPHGLPGRDSKPSGRSGP